MRRRLRTMSRRSTPLWLRRRSRTSSQDASAFRMALSHQEAEPCPNLSAASCGSIPFPRDGQTVAIEASPTEREALAALYRLPSIEALSAELTLERSGARRGPGHGRGPRPRSPRHALSRSSRSRRSSMRRSMSASPSSRTTSPPAGRRESRRRSRSTTGRTRSDHRRQDRSRRPGGGILRAGARSLSSQARRRVRSAPGSGECRIRLFRRSGTAPGRGRTELVSAVLTAKSPGAGAGGEFLIGLALLRRLGVALRVEGAIVAPRRAPPEPGRFGRGRTREWRATFA